MLLFLFFISEINFGELVECMLNALKLMVAQTNSKIISMMAFTF